MDPAGLKVEARWCTSMGARLASLLRPGRATTLTLNNNGFRMVQQPVQQRCGQRRIPGEAPWPPCVGDVGGDDRRGRLVPFAYDLEQQFRPRLSRDRYPHSSSKSCFGVWYVSSHWQADGAPAPHSAGSPHQWRRQKARRGFADTPQFPVPPMFPHARHLEMDRKASAYHLSPRKNPAELSPFDRPPFSESRST